MVLTVRQRSRDAITLQAGNLLVLDSDGYVVSVGDTAPEDGMPYVMGLKAVHLSHLGGSWTRRTPAERHEGGAGGLKAQGATGYVSELNVEDLKYIRILTRKGTTVLLGDADNMNNKIVWMVGTLRDLESRGENLGRLDVSSGSKADFLLRGTPRPRPPHHDRCLTMPDAGNAPTPDSRAGGSYHEDVI